MLAAATPLRFVAYTEGMGDDAANPVEHKTDHIRYQKNRILQKRPSLSLYDLLNTQQPLLRIG